MTPNRILPEDRNRRLSPIVKFKNTICILSIVGVIILVCFIGYFAFYINNFSDQESLSSSSDSGVTTTKLSNLTTEQILMLEELRNELSENFTHEYMKTNRFLIDWLERKHWDFDNAKETMIEHLEWRKEYNMDSILTEDFNQSVSEFPFFSDGVDRQGRPVITNDVGLWDLRKAALSGTAKKTFRYIYSEYEKWFQYLQKSQDNGGNVTQILNVYNLAGFSEVKHACYHCLPYIVKLLFDLQDHYPGLIYKIILINTPSEFDVILSLAPEEIEKLLVIYGTNKAQWKEALFQLISPEQIRPQFGGTKKDFSVED